MVGIQTGSMHMHYHTLRRLALQLHTAWCGARVVECFSQVKDELIVVLAKPNGERIVVQAHVQPSFACVCTPEQYARARKNTIDLWPEILGLRIERFETPVWDRVLVLQLEQSYSIVFKLYGNRSNVLLLHHDAVLHIFRNQLEADRSFQLHALPVVPHHTLLPPPDSAEDLALLLPVCKKEALLWLNAHDYFEQSVDQRTVTWEALLTYLNEPELYVVATPSSIVCTLFRPQGTPLIHTKDAAEALLYFFRVYNRQRYVLQLRQQLMHRLNSRVEATVRHLEQCKQRLDELKYKERKNEWADLLMANLHAIPQGAKQVELYDFYNQTYVVLPIKEGLTPQQQAEHWYKKARNKKQEMESLSSLLVSREELLRELRASLELAIDSDDPVLLKSLLKKYCSGEETQALASTQFKTVEIQEYVVWIGRNAQNNEELLQAAHKDDLWLHARDVSGSHVVIRRKAGSSQFPAQVIEQAAAVAAWHSKRRTDSLCPVMVTPRKYVRKLKGGAPGQVRVERETVVMVKPQQA